MIRAAVLCSLLAVLLVGPMTAWGQTQASEPNDARGETLSLEQAIALALQHNRLIKNDRLEVEKMAERVEIARTRRLPQFELDFLGLQTITPIEFRFDRGSLGLLPAEFDLAAAQERAVAERTEIKEARLKMRQADYNRRLKKAESWPEVSLTLGYFSPLGVAVVPRNVAAVSVTVKWEPFDWGRKKRELTEAQKTIEQAGNALREAEAQILLDVSNRFRKLQEARAARRDRGRASFGAGETARGCQ